MSIVQRLPRVPVRFRSLYLGLLAVTALFGADLTVVGAVLPEMIRSFGWSYTEAAAVLAAVSIGYFASTFASGFVVPRLGPRATVVTGLVLMTGALAVFGATPLVLINVLLHGLVGVGLGAIEVVINYGAVRIERDGRSQLMNLLHAAFSVGAVAGPLLAARLLDSGIAWQIAFRTVAVGAAGMAAWLALLPFGRLEEGLGGDHHDATRSAATMPLDRGLLTISVALLFLYVGVEAGVSSWLGEYFVGFLGTSPAQGALMVMLFWGGVLGGRLLLAFCYHGTRAAEAILLLAVVALAGLAAAVTVNDRTMAAVGFVATGFGFSSIYPLVMSIVGRFFALRHQSMVIGFATTGGGIGSFLFPFVMALVAEQAGIRRGYLLYVAVSALLVLLSVAAVIKTRRDAAAERP